MKRIQGILVPETSIDGPAFYKGTYAERFLEKSISSFAGFGATDSFSIKQAGIIAALDIHVSGSLTVTPGTGSVGTTSRWPYDLIKAIRLSVNGVNNVINCSGAKLIAHRLMEVGTLTDRGVTQGIGGASPGTQVSQGTLSLNSENWGVGQNVSAVGAGNFAVDLYYRLPVAFDQVKLLGAIFAQTSATSLDVGIDWATQASLFTLSGNATVAFAPAVTTEGIVYSIPKNAQGDPVIPNLSAFHTLLQYNDFGVGTGSYESQLMGTGVGKRLLRVYWQLWSNSQPVPLTAANFGTLGWRYGGNETPQSYADGRKLRMYQERLYDSDIGAAGFACMDFASQWAMRDSVDEATATNLRLLVTPNNALTSPVLEVVQETLFAGATS